MWYDPSVANNGSIKRTDQTEVVKVRTLKMILLINTFDRLPNSIGTVVSVHRSREAAEKANIALQSAVKRGHGRNAYLPTTIAAGCKGRWRKGDDVRESEIVSE